MTDTCIRHKEEKEREREIERKKRESKREEEKRGDASFANQINVTMSLTGLYAVDLELNSGSQTNWNKG